MGRILSLMRSSLASMGCSLFFWGGCDDAAAEADMAAACNAEVASMLYEIRDGCVKGCINRILEGHDVVDRRRR